MGKPRLYAPAPDESRGRRRALVRAALAALLVVMIVALWPKAAKRTLPEADYPPAEEARSAAPPPAATPAPRVVVLPHDDEPAPIIDDIVLEKTEVCAGEENLVTVKAHTVNGTDGWLHYSLDGQAGASVPIALWLDDNGKVVGNHFVSVFGRYNTLTSVPLPSYRVKDCQPYRVVQYYRRGVGQSPPDEVPVESVLGTTKIPPGREGLVTTAMLDTMAEPDTFSVTYDLTGKAADGHPVMGAFSILVPPAKPNAENSQPVTDPPLKAKILAARRILGQDVVNKEDLTQLERQGALADVTARMPAGR